MDGELESREFELLARLDDDDDEEEEEEKWIPFLTATPTKLRRDHIIHVMPEGFWWK